MHCDCCDKLLTPYEVSLKHAITGEFVNTCTKCLEGLSIPTKGKSNLLEESPYEEDENVDYVPIERDIYEDISGLSSEEDCC